jgi:hypothetical protein
MIPTPPPVHAAAPLRRPPTPRPSSAGVSRLAPGVAPADEVPLAAVQGMLALDLGRVPGRTAAAPALYAVPAPAPAEDAELRAWCARFAQAVVEVTGGDRPLTQLVRWTSTKVYAELGRRVQVMAQARQIGTGRRVVRPQVRSVHLCRPTEASAEVSVHVRYGQRSRALAARLEHRDGHWTCTALVVG